MSTIWQQLRACNESDENLQSSTSLGSSSCTLSYCQQENNAPFMCDGTLLGASLLLQASYDSLHYLGRLLAMLLELRSGFEGFRAFLPSFLPRKHKHQSGAKGDQHESRKNNGLGSTRTGIEPITPTRPVWVREVL
ncbi:unnamed protein product [Musa banksii]